MDGSIVRGQMVMQDVSSFFSSFPNAIEGQLESELSSDAPGVLEREVLVVVLDD
jgi:hypothetical protein